LRGGGGAGRMFGAGRGLAGGRKQRLKAE
jgi:hypothetical protein